MKFPASMAIEGLMGDIVTADRDMAAKTDFRSRHLRQSQAERDGGGDAGEVSPKGVPGHL
jgi:hypothetical protein